MNTDKLKKIAIAYADAHFDCGAHDINKDFNGYGEKMKASCDKYCALMAALATEAAEFARLKSLNAELVAALREVCVVLISGDPAIVDTVWVSNGQPETLFDHCTAVLDKVAKEAS